MPGLETIFVRLAKIPNPAVDLAIASALPTADTPALGYLTQLALSRADSEALTALVEQFHRLPDDSAWKVVARAADLAGAMRRALDRASPRGPVNVVEIIRRARAAELAYLVADPMRIGPAELRRAAGRCLMELAQATLASEDHPPAFDARRARAVQQAVEEAVTRYRFHQSPTSLEALLILARRPWTIAGPHLDQPSSPGVSALRTMLTLAETPTVRRSLLAMLGRETLAASAIAGLRNVALTGRDEQTAEALTLCHLLRTGRFRARLKRATGMATVFGDRPKATDPGSRRRWVVWCAAVSRGEALVQRLEQATVDDDRTTRMMTLRRLIEACDSAGESAPAIESAIAAFCMDTEPAIARAAVRFLQLRRWRGLEKLLSGLVRSDDEALRTLAVRAIAEEGFRGLWRNWERLTVIARAAAGRAIAHLDEAFVIRLRSCLRKPERESQVRAIAMVRELDLAPRLTRELLALTWSPDAWVASAAARALGTAAGPQAPSRLGELLEHADARVRANAAEALGAMQWRDGAGAIECEARLMSMARKDRPRPRAQAIGAMLAMRSPRALDALGEMLRDSRPAQRRSALWLIESTGVIDLNALVAETAVSDAEQEIRHHAGRTLRSLLARMNAQGVGCRVLSLGS